MNILAVESSCDETAAAVIQDGTKILSNVVATSTTMFAKYGGIVPEVAAREQLKYIIPVLTEALLPFSQKGQPGDYLSIIKNNIDAIAITVGPGLIGSLLVGIETAKTIALLSGKPIIPVNHVLAHMFANFLDSDQENSLRGNPRRNIDSNAFPAISLVVSGGHTELFLVESEKNITWLGGTLDDAAGEAFDKTARLLGFENRGGPAIQEAASKLSNKNAKNEIRFPRPMLHDGTLNFSFSGLKTAILREVNKLKDSNTLTEDIIYLLAHEVQEAICDVLVAKTLQAAETYNAKSILLSGGVAANLRLREKFNIHNTQYSIHIPPVALCTDNAVYIASYAFFRGSPVNWKDITAIPDLSVENL